MKEYPARQSHKINLKVQLRRLSSGRGEGIAIDTDIYIYMYVSPLYEFGYAFTVPLRILQLFTTVKEVEHTTMVLDQISNQVFAW